MSCCTGTLSLDFGEYQERDKRADTDKGCYPTIALNNWSVVVEVNHQMATNWMFYRVGRVVENKIQWGSTSPNNVPKKIFYGSGAYPRVSINDSNIIVEVHKGQYLDRCFCRVGKVQAEMISWCSSAYFNVGLRPTVAVNNSNIVVAVFQDNVFTKHLNYRVGRISEKMEIDWYKSKQKVKARGVVCSVDINDNDLVVLSYQTSLNHIHYKVGKLYKGLVEWQNIVHKCIGFTPSITINDNNEVVLVHQSFARRHLVSNIGMALWESDYKGIVWSENSEKHYATGIYPSISLNNDNQVVQVNEPRLRPNRNRLRYYVGEITQ